MVFYSSLFIENYHSVTFGYDVSIVGVAMWAWILQYCLSAGHRWVHKRFAGTTDVEGDIGAARTDGLGRVSERVEGDADCARVFQHKGPVEVAQETCQGLW